MSHPFLPSTSHLPPSSSSPSTDIKIKLPLPYACSTTHQLLKYEWIIFGTLCILLLSTLDQEMQNLRVVLYCVLFLLLETIRNSTKCLEVEDPLELSPVRNFMKQATILIQVNMTYLLFRILIDHHNVYSFLLFLHYSVIGVMNFDSKNKKNYEIQTTENPTLWKMITPFLLFVFSIIVNRNISQVSIVQLTLLTFNLVLTIEIKMLLINKECYIFGWEKHGFEGKNHLIFNRYQAVKKIMFAICAAVAMQNLMFVLPTMNEYASFTMFYSLVLGGYIFYIDRKSSPSLSKK